MGQQAQARLSARAAGHVFTLSSVCINTGRVYKKLVKAATGGERTG